MTFSARLVVFSPADASPTALDETRPSAWIESAQGVQGTPITASAPDGLTATAWDLDATPDALAHIARSLRAHTAAQQAAYLVPASLLTPGPSLVVTDVDSTLIEQEVIEMLAAHAGREAEVAAVTERAMRGELDFAQSLHERVKALAGLPVALIEEVAAAIVPTAGAQKMIAAAHAAGHTVGAVSGGFIQVLEPLADRLGLDHAHANVLGVRDGSLTGTVEGPVVDRAAKAEALRRWSAADGVQPDHTVGLGDGANDLDLLGAVALGVGVQPKPALREVATGVLGLRRLDTLPAALGWPA